MFKPDDELYIAITIGKEAKADELWKIAENKTSNRILKKLFSKKPSFGIHI